MNLFQTQSERLDKRLLNVCVPAGLHGQLSQTDCAMLRVIEYSAKTLKVTQDHSKWHPWYGVCKSLLVLHCSLSISCCFWDTEHQIMACDLEICVRDHSRWKKIVPIESLDTVSYSYSVVTMDVRHKAIYWLKIMFFIPPALDVPVTGVLIRILLWLFGMEKLKWCG